MTPETETQQCNSLICDEWDDTKLRHAYLPENKRIALCGYDGPSTWKGTTDGIPPNACPICVAILPEYFNALTRTWIRTTF